MLTYVTSGVFSEPKKFDLSINHKTNPSMKNVLLCLLLFILSVAGTQAQVSIDPQKNSDEYEYAVLYFVSTLRGGNHDSLRIYYEGGRIENLMRYHLYPAPVDYYKSYIASFKYLEGNGYLFLTNMSPNEYLFRRRKQ